ncbi:MAG: hypothetical protein H6745_09605 [Deltaproteobacteria bacterium]|nr:hypothetical protein [Deltaproteobacteria bacterium]
MRARLREGGACACEPTGEVACCGDALCPVDACGGAGEPVAACAFGCSDGACLACDAPCGGAECGDDGCGRSCGTCDGAGEACVGGRCACVADDHDACCELDGGGAAVCRFDSCGGREAVVAACPSGCDGGRCLACEPDCAGRACGSAGCGGSCGSCEGGAVCGDEGACACAPRAGGVACCDGALCAVDSCGAPGEVVAACPGGCDEGGCHGCAPACEGRACGDDGCGGSCGACGAPGEVCDAASGQCVCEPRVGVACCEGGICFVDGCGGLGERVTSCPFGCAGGACLACAPDCGGRACGDDGCGGSCGACEGTTVACEEGACVCTGAASVGCCGDDDVCAFDACGVETARLEQCERGCEGGACRPCVGSCAGAECGGDGCGGSCGECHDGEVCTAQRVCACAPTVLTGCCGDALCALDSCGGVGAPVEACPWGCAGGACLPCPASCEGVECGDDGCGGSCGACAGDDVCLDDGSCCERACEGRVCGDDGCGGACGACAAPYTCDDAGQCELVAEGRLLRERREPNASLSGLTAPVAVPVVGLEVVLTAGEVELGRVVTDAEGRFRLPLAAAPTGTVRATLAAAAPDEDGYPFVTLIDTVGVSFPTQEHKVVPATRAWAWTVVAPAGSLDLGETTITQAQGSGALEILGTVRDALDRVLARLGLARRDAPSLAVVWAPNTTPSCLACYFPDNWGPLELQGAATTSFDRFMWLSGTTPYAPLQWTPSLSLHELGHYVLDVFSYAPQVGGTHSWAGRTNAALAWSEGHATFFGQTQVSAMAGSEQARFFGIQGGTNYWVDLEAIGSSGIDSSYAPLTSLPLPQPGLSMTQDLNEGAVAAILWDAWDAHVAAGEADTMALGDAEWAIVRGARYRDAALDRGYSAPDLVDWLDAARCEGLATGAGLATVLMGFPYDDTPICPAAP